MLIILCIFCLLSYLLLSGLILRSVSRDAVKMDVYWNGSMIEMSFLKKEVYKMLCHSTLTPFVNALFRLDYLKILSC